MGIKWTNHKTLSERTQRVSHALPVYISCVCSKEALASARAKAAAAAELEAAEAAKLSTAPLLPIKIADQVIQQPKPHSGQLLVGNLADILFSTPAELFHFFFFYLLVAKKILTANEHS